MISQNKIVYACIHFEDWVVSLGMSNTIRMACQEIFREAFEGVAPDKDYTWFVQGSEAILNTLQSLSAEQASKKLHGMTSTIGAHANHLCYFLHLFNANNRGSREPSDWEGSWDVQEFDENSWNDVVARTTQEYVEANRWYTEMGNFDVNLETFDDEIYVIANIAHAAYHLGAIRALLPMV